MSTSVTLAILLRPLFNLLVMFLVVAPLAWLLYQLIPDGRAKVFLFKVRSGKDASRRDKVIMTLGVVAGYALLICFGAFLVARGP